MIANRPQFHMISQIGQQIIKSPLILTITTQHFPLCEIKIQVLKVFLRIPALLRCVKHNQKIWVDIHRPFNNLMALKLIIIQIFIYMQIYKLARDSVMSWHGPRRPHGTIRPKLITSLILGKPNM